MIAVGGSYIGDSTQTYSDVGALRSVWSVSLDYTSNETYGK